MNEGPKEIAKRLRWKIKSFLGRDVHYSRTIDVQTEVVGKGPAQWIVAKDSIAPDTIIYSFGIGTNIDFDLDLIRRFGATVHAFDPTPRSLQWLGRQDLPEQFKVYPIGLAAENGTLRFHAPERDDFVSYSVGNVPGNTASVALEVKRLSTIMADIGHAKIDVLKLDIEGSEYEVIEDLLESDVCVGQVLVEFHHRFQAYDIQATQNAIESLLRAGYGIFYTSPTGEEYSFIRR